MLFRRAKRVHAASTSSSAATLYTARGPSLADTLANNALSCFTPSLEKVEIHEAEDVAALSVTELQQLFADAPIGQLIKLRRICTEAAPRVASKQTANPFTAVRDTVLAVGIADNNLKGNFELIYETVVIAATLCCSITASLVFDLQPTCSDGTTCFALRAADLILVLLSFACYFMTVVVGIAQVLCLVTLNSEDFSAFLQRHWFLAIMPLTSWVLGNQCLIAGAASHMLVRLPADLASFTWAIVAFWAAFAVAGWSIVAAVMKRALVLRWLQLPAAMAGFLFGLGYDDPKMRRDAM